MTANEGPPGSRRRFGLGPRLMLGIVAVVVVAVAGAFIYVYRGTGDKLRAQTDSELAEAARSLAGRLAPADAGGPDAVLAAAHRYIDAQPFGPASRVLAVSVPGAGIATNEPEVLGLRFERHGESASERATEVSQSARIRDSPPGFETVELEDAGEVRLLTVPLEGGATAATVRVAQPLESVERAQAGVAQTFAVAALLAIVAALIGGFVVAQRIARPLRRMAGVAAEVDAGELSRRIDARGSRDEVRTLAVSFNHMLDRLERAFSVQRDFVADASHELRTPLTVIRGQIEVLARSGDADPREIRRVEAVVLEEVDSMDRLVDDLLVLARAEEAPAPRTGPIDLGRLLADQVEALRPPGPRRLVLAEVAPGVLETDRDALVRVLRNLISNALAHVGETGTVQISAIGDGEMVEIRVEDDGPGIPEGEQERVFERFHRGARSPDGGAGLGLAIARALVESRGGRIRAGASALGGALVAFSLPGFRASESHEPH